jgi:hypothetical protein
MLLFQTEIQLKLGVQIQLKLKILFQIQQLMYVSHVLLQIPTEQMLSQQRAHF